MFFDFPSALHAARLWLQSTCPPARARWLGTACAACERVPASEIKFIEAPLAVPLTRTVPSP